MNTSLKSSVLKGTFWSGVEQYATQGVSMLLGIFMARLLSPSEYGLIGMLAIFIAIANVFIDGGLAKALVRCKDRSEKDFSTVFYINVFTSISIYLLLFLGAPFISKFYNQEQLTSITRVYCLILVISSLGACRAVKLTIAVDFKTTSKISIIQSIISGIIGIIFAFRGYGVWALVYQALVSSILRVCLLYYFVRWKPLLVFSTSSFKKLFAFSSKMLASSLISNLYNHVYNLFIGKIYNSAVLGNYTRANSYGAIIGSNIGNICQRSLFPIFSKIQDDDERLIDSYRRYMKTITFVIFPLQILLATVAKPLIIILLTDKWINCITLLQILCFAWLWDVITMTNLNLLYIKGYSGKVLKLEIIKKIIGFTILLSTVFINITALCIGRVVYALIATSLNTYYINKYFHYGLKQQIKDILPWLLLSLCLFALGLLIIQNIHNLYLSLIITTIFFLTVYLFVSYHLHFEPLIEIKQIIRDILPEKYKQFFKL